MTETLKLYYAPAVCSLAPHVALREAGAEFTLVRVDLRSKQTAAGEDYTRINPKGYVPALRLADGSLLTETSILLHHIADAWPAARLAPPHGTPARLRLDETVQFIATELHKSFAPFTIMPNPGEEARRWAAGRLTARVDLLARTLGEREFLHGEGFTIADAYAFFALRTYRHILAAELPANLADYVERLATRPAIRDALAAEAARESE